MSFALSMIVVPYSLSKVLRLLPWTPDSSCWSSPCKYSIFSLILNHIKAHCFIRNCFSTLSIKNLMVHIHSASYKLSMGLESRGPAATVPWQILLLTPSHLPKNKTKVVTLGGFSKFFDSYFSFTIKVTSLVRQS